MIEVELGKTKFYLAFQFRDGKIIDALAKINKELASSCSGAEPIDVARALLDWWQTPHPDLPRGVEGSHRSPIELLNALPEEDFAAVVRASEALKGFIAPDFASESAVERR